MPVHLTVTLDSDCQVPNTNKGCQCALPPSATFSSGREITIRLVRGRPNAGTRRASILKWAPVKGPVGLQGHVKPLQEPCKIARRAEPAGC